MNEYMYVPSIKSKRGECLALKELAGEVKARIKPIINIINITDVSRFYDKKAFVDLHPNILENAPSVKNIYQEIHQKASQTFELTSVLKHGYSREMILQIKPYLFNIENGVALRIPRANLASLKSDIDSICQVLQISSNRIDVIIDFECINDIALGLVSEFSENIKKALSAVNINNVIVLASAFPISITTPKNAISDLSRYDFLLFSALRKSLPNIIFGDYGSDDPFDPKIESRVNIVPAIRYAHDNCWKIVRGYYDPAMPYDFSQFCNLAKTLITCEFYKGHEYSWGDNKIFQCANGTCGSGNLETWVRVAMNHHITFVVNEHDRLLLS